MSRAVDAAVRAGARRGTVNRLSPAAAARLERLYRDYAPRLVGHVARTTHRRRDQVEDSCQHAWAVLARRPDVLDGPSARGWLVTVAMHQYVAESRRRPRADRVDERRRRAAAR